MSPCKGRFCGRPLLTPQWKRSFATALAVKTNSKKGESEASEELLYDIDKGWAPDANELAQQIQTAITESQGESYTESSQADIKGDIVFSTSWEVIPGRDLCEKCIPFRQLGR